VQSPQGRVPRQHIGIVRNLERLENLHGTKIQDLEQPVAFARDECKTSRLVERKAMRMIGPGKIIALNDALADWIDRRQLIPRLYRDENAVRYRIVVGVSCLTTKLDRRSLSARFRVDHNVGAA